jgi:hypothetical protein
MRSINAIDVPAIGNNPATYALHPDYRHSTLGADHVTKPSCPSNNPVMLKS